MVRGMFMKQLHEMKISEICIIFFDESMVKEEKLKQWAIAVVKEKIKNENWSDVIPFLMKRFEITEKELE